MRQTRKRYALSGLSARAVSHFALPLLGAGDAGQNDFSESCEVVGILDADRERVEAFLGAVRREVPYFGAGEMKRMIRDTRPDCVLIATPDHVHCDDTIEALEAGCDVVVEKPMTITSEQASRVREAESRTGRKVTVAFNYRYMPQHQAIKRAIRAGTIGRITNVEFVYNLNTLHGSSYFSRWNRRRSLSGGLNMHKCCHHFDLVNWLLEDDPESVFAFGRLNYYGAEGALRPRDSDGAALDRVAEKKACPIFQKHHARKYDPEAASVIGLGSPALPYSDQYPADRPRYIYDDEIDVEDTYSVLVRYRKGASLAYSCNFCTPWEGYNLGINGTLGRIEAEQRITKAETHSRITCLPLFGQAEELQAPEAEGGHGGADPIIQRDLFGSPSQTARELGLLAGSRDGSVAVALAEAVWISLRDEKLVRLNTSFLAPDMKGLS